MQNTNIEIKSVTKNDIPLLLKLIKQLAEFEKNLNQVEATEETLYEALLGQNKVAEAVLAYDNDKNLIGYAIFFHNFSTWTCKKGLYLEDLYIIPEARKKGYGKLIMQYLANLALERGCKRMEWCVIDWNHNAMKLYDKIGGKKLDEWFFYRLSEEKLQALANKE